VNVAVGGWVRDAELTWPHRWAEAEHTFWPQATTLVHPEKRVFVVAAGGGGGSTQALMRTDLGRFLRQAAAWVLEHDDAEARVDALFAATQQAFESFGEVDWGWQFTATAAALALDNRHGALASLGFSRIYRRRAGQWSRLSEDVSFARRLSLEGASLGKEAAILHTLAGSWFHGLSPHPDEGSFEPASWTVRRVDVAPGDLFVLATSLEAVRDETDPDRSLFSLFDAALADTQTLEEAAAHLGASLETHLEPRVWPSRVALLFIEVK